MTKIFFNVFDDIVNYFFEVIKKYLMTNFKISKNFLNSIHFLKIITDIDNKFHWDINLDKNTNFHQLYEKFNNLDEKELIVLIQEN